MTDETRHNVVWIIRISDRVCSAEKHLKTNIRHPRPKLPQAFPWVLVEESHRRVEGCPTPHIDGKQLGGPLRQRTRTREHVVASHARRHERLMGIAECGVSHEQPLLL